VNSAAGRVIACVVRRGKTLLVCQRPPHKRHGGLWEFPGGKTEPGESDSDAATRELSEELAVRVTATGSALFEVVDPGSTFVIAFVPVQIEGEPTCLEHVNLTWGPPGDLLGLPLAPSDRAFVEYLMSRPELAADV